MFPASSHLRTSRSDRQLVFTRGGRSICNGAQPAGWHLRHQCDYDVGRVAAGVRAPRVSVCISICTRSLMYHAKCNILNLLKHLNCFSHPPAAPQMAPTPVLLNEPDMALHHSLEDLIDDDRNEQGVGDRVETGPDVPKSELLPVGQVQQLMEQRSQVTERWAPMDTTILARLPFQPRP